MGCGGSKNQPIEPELCYSPENENGIDERILEKSASNNSVVDVEQSEFSHPHDIDDDSHELLDIIEIAELHWEKTLAGWEELARVMQLIMALRERSYPEMLFGVEEEIDVFILTLEQDSPVFAEIPILKDIKELFHLLAHECERWITLAESWEKVSGEIVEQVDALKEFWAALAFIRNDVENGRPNPPIKRSESLHTIGKSVNNLRITFELLEPSLRVFSSEWENGALDPLILEKMEQLSLSLENDGFSNLTDSTKAYYRLAETHTRTLQDYPDILALAESVESSQISDVFSDLEDRLTERWGDINVFCTPRSTRETLAAEPIIEEISPNAN